MLVISRGLKESFYLQLEDGREIKVIMISFTDSEKGGKEVRVGIDAPQTISIVREEIKNKQKKA